MKGVEDFVTVNRSLPTDGSGRLVYASQSASSGSAHNELWVPLLEKAFAQWNETGRLNGRDGTNSYGVNGVKGSGINAGDPADAFTYLVGHRPLQPGIGAGSTQSSVIAAFSSGRAVTFCSKDGLPDNGPVVGNHAFVLTGYSSSTKRFSFYNPWGNRHPTGLTWAEVQKYFGSVQIADPDGSPVANGSLSLRGNRVAYFVQIGRG